MLIILISYASLDFWQFKLWYSLEGAAGRPIEDFSPWLVSNCPLFKMYLFFKKRWDMSYENPGASKAVCTSFHEVFNSLIPVIIPRSSPISQWAYRRSTNQSKRLNQVKQLAYHITAKQSISQSHHVKSNNPGSLTNLLHSMSVFTARCP